MYIIYKITNRNNNKSYIGQTKQTLEKRWYGHMIDATTRKATHQYHFLRALLKHGFEVWDKTVIEEGLTKDEVNDRESYWISFYNTYYEGYNSTLGGDNCFPDQTNTKSYTFYAVNGTNFLGTIEDFCKEYSIARSSVIYAVYKQGLLGKTWSIVEDVVIKYRKHIEALKCQCGNKKSKKANTCFKCRDLSGVKNGMTGVKRPQYVKDAVSKRMRDSADKTLRDWIHPEHGIEFSITSIALRDKYSLNISNLKKITDNKPKYKTHKGWQLYARNNN